MFNSNSRIKKFPITFFSIIMGLAGFVISLQKATNVFNISKNISSVLLLLTMLLFFIIFIVYSIKFYKYPAIVKSEFFNPIKINFFPTFSIGLLLISVALLPISLVASKYFWLIGTITHFIFTLTIINTWMHQSQFKITHFNPAWFIPAVGNILIPIAGVNHFSKDLSWFFFSFGFFFWIILLVIFFYRIFFHELLSEKLLPTLFILIAPPAISSISFFKLTGEITIFSKMLYYFGLFLTILLLSQINIFRKIKFYLSWWAYSFPIASISIASALMYQETNIFLYKQIYLVLLLGLILLISVLIAKTIKAIVTHQICIDD